MSPKNSLSIRLTEPVVFLRGSAETTVTGRRTTRESQPAMLRGLLTLTLDKPTKISSIEITLQGGTQTAWPEGVGPRRLEVTEEHEILSATQYYFRAGKSRQILSRRTASVGPGLLYDYDHEHEEIDDESITHEGLQQTSQESSSNSANSRRRISMDYRYLQQQPGPPSLSFLDDIPTPPYSPPGTRPGSLRGTEILNMSSTNMPPFPHRSDSNISASSDSINSSRALDRGASQHDSHHATHSVHENSEPQSSSSSITDPPLSRPVSHEGHDSEHSLAEASLNRGRARIPLVHANGTSLPPSRTPSISTAPTSPISQLLHSSFSHLNHPNNSNGSSILNSSHHNSSLQSQPQSNYTNGSVLSPVDSGTTRETSASRERGRRHARFSLASVSNALLDAVKERVRSNSPRPRAGKEHAHTPAASRDHSPEGHGFSLSRGRYHNRSREISVERNFESGERGRSSVREEDSPKNKERTAIGRFAEALRLDLESGSGGDGDGWKEFRKGTYTYPISFSIPGDSPPSLQCEFGCVSYQLKATVHRPGTFTHKLTASHEVTLIASPGEDDLDESDNILVQREWDSQMHYMITISGRAFPIGSTIPIHITFMPISKVKIFRISALIEEKVDYHTQFKRVARSEAVRKFELLNVRYYEKDAPPVLPLTTDYETSPLRGLVEANDDSDAASSLMGPGPWSIQADLQLPKSCAAMHFTNKHKRSNITISHVLKIVFRVERGDDLFLDSKTGMRKHFDIVVQTPLHILSCRCNPEWTSLPRYSNLALNQLSKLQSCPCAQRRKGMGSNTSRLEPPQVFPPITMAPLTDSPTASRRTSFHNFLHPFEAHASHPDHVHQDSHTPHSHSNSHSHSPSPSPYHAGLPLSRHPSDTPSDLRSLYRRNTQFARLVAGEESEVGEAPPQYEPIAPSDSGLAVIATEDVVTA